ncbi:MAG: 2OG-Fe(II) oxygenase [Gemmobacter sp.]|nr:2OG-Fe(II) oxygenase [Gemmobacter sp.]
MSKDLTTQAAPSALILPGDRVPSLVAKSSQNPQFRLDSMAGRWLVLGVIGSAALPGMADRLTRVMADAGPFDDTFASLFVVTQDPADAASGRLSDRMPGRRIFWDDDSGLARQLGALTASPGTEDQMLTCWIVVDPSLSVHRVIMLRTDGSDVEELMSLLAGLPPPDRWLGFEVPAPILVLPQVFEPELCDHLIGLYNADGGKASGFMRDQGGKTVAMNDPGFKVRRDFLLDAPQDIRAVQARILRRVVPQIERVFFFRATRMDSSAPPGWNGIWSAAMTPQRAGISDRTATTPPWARRTAAGRCRSI